MNPLEKSIHLMRKSNEFTMGTPNRWLFDRTPYHVIERIALQDRRGELTIRRYLSKVEIFSSSAITTPYCLVINIDRSRTDPHEERQILSCFGSLKEKHQYPGVSFAIMFSKVDYPGERH